MSETTFEETLARLEAVVLKLESGDLPLDEALQAFEEGVRLARVCSTRLEDAERRVHLLMRTADGQEAEVPFTVPGGATDV
jgi:exodeoxyribonuclease VII small subunit